MNTTITKLTLMVDALVKEMEKHTIKNNESHARMWERIDSNDNRLDNHETRLAIIEKSEGLNGGV